jgi:hypothetical protein
MLRSIVSAVVAGGFVFGIVGARGSDDAARPVLYKLVKGSTYQEGCFDPCACPLTMEIPMRGTFRLTYLAYDGLFTHYAVDGVRWRAYFGSATRHITGAGMYRIGGEVAVQQQLELELIIDGEPRDTFDSGLVVGGYEYPKIDVAVSMHDMFCYDIVLQVRARPFGDINGDGAVDAADAAVLAQCLGGPDESPAAASPWTAEDCAEAFDADGDDDLDLVDFGVFTQAIRAAS